MSEIIILMGVSSSGKSTIAKAINELSQNAYEIVGFDYAVLKLDKKYWPGGSDEKLGFFYKEIKTDKGAFPELCHGEIGRSFLAEMLNDIIKKAKSGKNLIIDSVLSEKEFQNIETECSLSNITVVGIKPPLEVVIQREITRGDREQGIAEAAYEHFYNDKPFDLLIDTSTDEPASSAEKIQTYTYINKQTFSPF